MKTLGLVLVLFTACASDDEGGGGGGCSVANDTCAARRCA
jgi:hypothetical protein